ncbi:MAG TPA: valine--tRNA ligase [Planctomycetota bacterium]|nr:valine--tRNA ligase [Planctomycetota bacterium]
MSQPADASSMNERFDPKEVERKWFAEWEKKGVFHAEPGDPRPPFSIVIPPPNVTGVLHMGHALNNTFQDVITRWRRMQGRNACWIPGTDHAGIATQNVVEKDLKKKEHKTRFDLGREEFVKRVWAWKEQSGGTIIRQLKALGASCDWQREQFTMSPELSRAVREVFVKLYEEGQLYRGKRLVNWCVRCQTALSNEEAEPEKITGSFWYIKYPLEDGDFVTIATTRPETLLGDVAVAVNPKDESKKHLVGKTAILPFMNKKIPIIADDHVKYGEEQVGSGALKVTPAHDPNDFEIGQRHKLPMDVNILEEDGKISAAGGEFNGLDRFEARKQIVARLETMGLLEKTEQMTHEVPHCQRCGTVVEPLLSVQWFVRMKPLADRALKAHVEGDVLWHPEARGNLYRRWLEEIRDWCISRQLWWGHRIPVFYCTSCDAANMTVNAQGERRFTEKATPYVSREDLTTCPKCGGGPVVQDEDVLDTWFSSWLWPFSTMGWPAKTPMLDTFYPTDVLVTAWDIIFFWVARMIMAGYHFTGKRPFKDVFIHGIIRDKHGEKMSKSKGNAIDPLTIIDQFSADALRFTIVFLTSEGQDCKISEERFEEGRNFTTKIWNAARLVLSKSDPGCKSVGPQDAKHEVDRWILSRLHETIANVTRSHEQFRFNEALQTIYAFAWGNFCDWYLELAKPRLNGSDEERRTSAGIACYVLDRILRLLHPYVPFVTEELWSRLDATLQRAPSLIAQAKWPQADEAPFDADAERRIDARIEAVRQIRTIRNKYTVPPKQEIEAVLSGPDEASIAPFRGAEAFFKASANVAKLTVGVNAEKPRGSAHVSFGVLEAFVPGLFDPVQEKTRIEGLLAKKKPMIEGKKKKLENVSFKAKAPEQWEKERASLAELEAEIQGLERALAELASA